MIEKKNGGPAFPIYTPDMNVGDDAGPGMSLRDWFAGQALIGLVASGDVHLDDVARHAFGLADEMLAARSPK